MTVSLPESVRRVLSVIYAGSHFAVLEVMVVPKCIVVWEGKNYDIRSWHQHITFVLKQLQLIEFHSDLLHVSQSDLERNSTLRVEGEQEWQIRREAAMEQSDSYNCGPIACMKLWEAFYPDDKEPKTVSSGNCRDSILRKFEELYARMKDDFKIGEKELTGGNGAEYDVSQFVDLTKETPNISVPR
ncbi:hypothetical protein IV203_036779 [Nitzschia inconspicua]|uniref:Uncharacterized protein n=1 Tax=Nitzschia inconspicua TaxID=303405 RepID=A0A9K3PVY8_9STRA|nr:hypothetical protein IV203_036779 [Nitzschia inconspicua]